MRVGLTGGIASGKSTVARLFAARGIPVVDTDQLAREVVAPDTPGLAAVVERFGETMLDPSGGLDRSRLRAHVFADPAARADLEALLHPRIRAAVAEACAAARGPWLLLVIPLLVEKGWREEVDRVLVTDVDEASQIRRTMERDGVPREQAEAILASQASREERLAMADDIIETDGERAVLEHRVAELDRHYRALAASPGKATE